MASHGPQASVEDVKSVIRRITGADTPRKGQVDAVMSLLAGKDAILVAATSYGKSAVLYAFSALANKTAIQIVPLTKLGENQRDHTYSAGSRLQGNLDR